MEARFTVFLVTLNGEEMDMSLRDGRGNVDPGAVDMRFRDRDLCFG